MANDVAFELQRIEKELHELNKKLDRLCRASIFSIEKRAKSDPEPEIELAED